MCRFSRLGFLFGSLGLTALIGAQTPRTLTLNDVLKMARERNGTIIASQHDIEAAKARVTQASSALWPTVIPTYRYNSSRQQLATSSGSAFIQDEGGSTVVSANWRVFDSGQRIDSLRASQSSLAAQQFSSEQTVRSTMFAVTQDYYEALRAQELLRVAASQVDRTAQIVDQVKARIHVEDAAKIDEQQANVDYQNAKVQALVAKNRVSTNAAALKGIIGLPADQPLPELQAEKEIGTVLPPDSLESLITEGINRRPDLQSRRRSLQSLGYTFSRAKKDAGWTYGVDANFDQQLTPKSLESRTLTFSLSYPLFDAGQRKAAAKELQQSILAETAALTQAERTARAEIESAHASLTQNAERLAAAKIALGAAQAYYQAAKDSYQAGAYDLLQVSSAQVSLVTAESNYIEAVYDYRISEANLRLATGRPLLPG